MTLTEDAPSAVVRCSTSMRRSMVVRCCISTKARNTPCGQWSTVATRDCVNIGMSRVTPIIKRATAHSIVGAPPWSIITIWISSLWRWCVAGTTIGGNVLAQAHVSQVVVLRLSSAIPIPTIVASQTTAPVVSPMPCAFPKMLSSCIR